MLHIVKQLKATFLMTLNSNLDNTSDRKLSNVDSKNDNSSKIIDLFKDINLTDNQKEEKESLNKEKNVHKEYIINDTKEKKGELKKDINSIDFGLLDNKEFKRGDKSEGVKNLQKLLNNFRDEKNQLIPDGDYGNNTEMAVRKFQGKRFVLQNTGSANSETISALIKEYNEKNNISNKKDIKEVGIIKEEITSEKVIYEKSNSSNLDKKISGDSIKEIKSYEEQINVLENYIVKENKILSKGTKDKQPVIALQKLMESEGFYSNKVEGDFGPATKSALIKFQESLGLKGKNADGILGKNTIEFIKNKYEGTSIVSENNTIIDKKDVVNKFKETSKDAQELGKSLENSTKFTKSVEEYINKGGREDLVSGTGGLYGLARDLIGNNDKVNYFIENPNKEVTEKFDNAFESLFKNAENTSISLENAKRFRDVAILVLSYAASMGMAISIPLFDIFLKSQSINKSSFGLGVANGFQEWMNSGMKGEFNPKNYEGKTAEKFNKVKTGISQLDNILTQYNIDGSEISKETYKGDYEQLKKDILNAVNSYYKSLFTFDIGTILESSFSAAEKGNWYTLGGLFGLLTDDKYSDSKKSLDEINDIINKDSIDINSFAKILESKKSIFQNIEAQFTEEKIEKIYKELEKQINTHKTPLDEGYIRITKDNFKEYGLKNDLNELIKNEVNSTSEQYYKNAVKPRTEGMNSLVTSVNNIGEKLAFQNSPKEARSLDNLLYKFGDLNNLKNALYVPENLEGKINELDGLRDGDINKYKTTLEKYSSEKDFKEWLIAYSKNDLSNFHLNKLESKKESGLKYVNRPKGEHQYGIDLKSVNGDIEKWAEENSKTTLDKNGTRSAITEIQIGLLRASGIDIKNANLTELIKSNGKVVSPEQYKEIALNTSRKGNGKNDQSGKLLDILKGGKELVHVPYTEKFSFINNEGKKVEVTKEVNIFLKSDCSNVVVIPSISKVTVEGKDTPISNINFPEELTYLVDESFPVFMTVKTGSGFGKGSNGGNPDNPGNNSGNATSKPISDEPIINLKPVEVQPLI